MIRPKCFESAWITAQAKRLRARDAQLVEKCILAFELVARLRQEGLAFVFKGGTSLLLHIQPIRRFSIDVDIITESEIAAVQRVLAKVVSAPPFIRYEHQAHRERENPPTHYLQAFYRPVTGGIRPEDHIQLDVVVEKSPYPALVERHLQIDLFETDTQVPVAVPSVNDLLGDKLTAFAPSTIGVLYQPFPRNPGDKPPDPDPGRIMKQVFDVGTLFEHATDLTAVAAAYDATFALQRHYRRGLIDCTREQALDDTIDAARRIADIHLNPHNRDARSDLLKRGVGPVHNHLVGESFTVRSAQIPAARAALTAALIKRSAPYPDLPEVRPMLSVPGLAKLKIEGDYAAMQPLRKVSPEAFFRWHQVDQILSGRK